MPTAFGLALGDTFSAENGGELWQQDHRRKGRVGVADWLVGGGTGSKTDFWMPPACSACRGEKKPLWNLLPAYLQGV